MSNPPLPPDTSESTDRIARRKADILDAMLAESSYVRRRRTVTRFVTTCAAALVAVAAISYVWLLPAAPPSQTSTASNTPAAQSPAPKAHSIPTPARLVTSTIPAGPPVVRLWNPTSSTPIATIASDDEILRSLRVVGIHAAIVSAGGRTIFLDHLGDPIESRTP